MREGYTVSLKHGHRSKVQICEVICRDSDCPSAGGEHGHLLAWRVGSSTRSQVGFMADLLRNMGESGSIEVTLESRHAFERQRLDLTVVKVVQ